MATWLGWSSYRAEPYDLVDDLANSSSRVIACANKQIELPFFYTVSLGPAIGIIFTLAMYNKRKVRYQKCCQGSPGIVVPLNLLDEFEHRWSYAVAFGAITNTIFNILTGFDGQNAADKIPRSAKVLYTFGRAFEVCLNFFPFFACLHTKNVLLGSIMGAAYSTLWLVIKVFTVVDCADPVPTIFPYVTVISQTPVILCLLFLVLKYLWSIVLFCRGKHRGRTLQRIEGSVVFPFQMEHVRSLLRKPPPEVDWKSKELTCMQKLKAYYKKYYYDENCHFKHSTRVLCTLMIIFMGNYQMSIAQLYISKSSQKGLRGIAAEILNITNIVPVNSTRTVAENIESALILLRFSWDFSTAIAYALASFGLAGSLSNYKINLLALYRGDRSFYPPKYHVQSADYVSNSMKYAGYQIAYAIWGNIIMVLVLLVVTMVISFFFILPIINNSWATTLFVLEVILLPLVVSMALRMVQMLMAKYFFLQDKLSKDDEDKPLAINNRRFYHVADYFLFVANVAVGLFSCLLRILKGLLIGLFYLSRLDRCVLMSGWEKTDTGFTSYIGMLELEHAHNHPVMRVFCHIMNGVIPGRHVPAYTSSHVSFKSVSDSSQVTVDCSNDKIEPHKPIDYGCQRKDDISEIHTTAKEQLSSSVSLTLSTRCPNRARIRWYLAYSLIRNPTLIQKRHHWSSDETNSKYHEPPPGGDTEDVLLKLRATAAAIEMNQEVKTKMEEDLKMVVDSKIEGASKAELALVEEELDTITKHYSDGLVIAKVDENVSKDDKYIDKDRKKRSPSCDSNRSGKCLIKKLSNRNKVQDISPNPQDLQNAEITEITEL